MRKVVLGMSALALMTAAAWAQTDEPTTGEMETATASFSKLDSDGDGRISAIEAANDTQIAASFTQADQDGDGYLSREEFESISSGMTQPGQSPDSGMGSEPQQ